MAGSLGYCGLDRRRQPLVGDEIRGCWEAEAAVADPALAATTLRTGADARLSTGRAAPLEFIEVHGRMASAATASAEPAAPDVDPTGPSADGPVLLPPPGPPSGDLGWSLWGDLER